MVQMTVNGTSVDVDAAPETALLYVLRNDLGLKAAKFGCGLAQCGTCTVVVDGEAVFSCVTPVSAVEGAEILTVEGLGSVAEPGPLQKAFIAEQAAQCGYCIPGMMMRAHALLQSTSDLTEEALRDGMAPNLCRCGTHMRILRAVRRAAEEMRADSAEGSGSTRQAEGASQ